MSEYTAEPADDSDYTAGLDTGEDNVIDLDETMGSDNVDDVLDTSYSPPEKPLGVTKFGTTLAEEREGESLDQRLAQEEPDPALELDVEEPLDEQADAGGQAGYERAGRLVDPDEGAHTDREKDLVGSDVGIDGGAASAEEAAMHVVSEDDLVTDGFVVDEGSSI